jgi:hypothetical protein
MTTFSPYVLGKRRHTKVELPSLHRAADAPVLRQAALRDVQIAMIFRRLVIAGPIVAGRVHHLEQLAVDAEPHLDFFSEGSMWISDAPSFTAFWMM